MDGITNNVRKVAKVRPKIIAQAIGPKNTILSPPRFIAFRIKKLGRRMENERIKTFFRLTIKSK